MTMSRSPSPAPKRIKLEPSESPSIPTPKPAENGDELVPDAVEVDEESCSICLQRMEDRTIVPPCSHEFCFDCLLVWSEQSRRCPLCSQGIGEYLIHHVRSRFDYQKHYLTPLRSSPAPLQPLARTSTGSSHRRRPRQREWGRRERGEREESDRLDRAIARRRWIYEHDLYAKHVASNAYTRYRPYPAPAQFSASPELITRATIFLRRELQVWMNLDVEFLTTFTISLMKAIDIRSESAVKLLAEFLDMDEPYVEGGRHVNAEHFAHEIYSYLRSPYKDLFVYDSVVQYDVPPEVEIVPPPTLRRRWESPGDQAGRPHRSQSRPRSRSRSVSSSRARSRSLSWSPSGRRYPSVRHDRRRLPEHETSRRSYRDHYARYDRGHRRSPSLSRSPPRRNHDQPRRSSDDNGSSRLSVNARRSATPANVPVSDNKGKRKAAATVAEDAGDHQEHHQEHTVAPSRPKIRRPPRVFSLSQSVHAHLGSSRPDDTSVVPSSTRPAVAPQPMLDRLSDPKDLKSSKPSHTDFHKTSHSLRSLEREDKSGRTQSRSNDEDAVTPSSTVDRAQPRRVDLAARLVALKKDTTSRDKALSLPSDSSGLLSGDSRTRLMQRLESERNVAAQTREARAIVTDRTPQEQDDAHAREARLRTRAQLKVRLASEKRRGLEKDTL